MKAQSPPAAGKIEYGSECQKLKEKVIETYFFIYFHDNNLIVMPCPWARLLTLTAYTRG